MLSEKRKLLTPAVILGCLILSLSLAVAVYAAPVAGDVSISGEHKTVGETDYYTGDVTLSTDVSSEDGLKSAVLTVNGQTVETKTLEGTSAEVKFEIAKSKIISLEPASRKYEAKITVKDINDEEKDCEKTFYADASEPEVTLSGVENGNIYNSAKTPKVKMTDKNIATDDTSITIKKDGETVKSVTDPEQCADYDSYTASDDGAYKVEATIKDKTHSAEKSVSFTIDRTAPSLGDLNFTGEKKESYSWFCSDVSASAEASDRLTGLDRCEVFLNGSKVGEAEYADGSYSFTFTESMLQEKDNKGHFTVRFDAYDKAGNKGTVNGSFNASIKAPDVTLSGIESGSFTNEKPTVQAESEVPEKTASVDMQIKRGDKDYSTKSGETSAEFTPTEDGAYTITAAVTDKAGNKSSEKSISFIYDTTSPVCEKMNISGPRREGYTWYYDYVEISADMTDELSGLKICTITVNDEKVAEEKPEGDLEKSISVKLNKAWLKEHATESCKYEVVLNAEDRAGNTYTKKATFYADVVRPEVAISGIKDGKHTNKKTTIKAEVTDNRPDLNTIIYTITRNGKPYKEYKKKGQNASFNAFKPDGRYKVTVKSVDLAGNTSEAKTLRFVKDTVAPVISISGAKAGSYTTGAKSLGAHVKELNYKTVKVSGTITRVLDGKTTNIGWGKITPNKVDYIYKKKVNGTGTYTVTLSAVDLAGNKAAKKTLKFTIDNDKPIVKITNVKDVNGYMDTVSPKASWEDSYFAAKNVTLTRISGKSSAGLSSRESKNAKGGTRTYSNFIKQKEYDDIYRLTCTCTDKAGNKTTVTKTFTVCRFGSKFTVNKSSRPFNGSYLKNVEEKIYITETNPAGIGQPEGIITLDGARLDQTAKTTVGTRNGWAACTYEYPAAAFEAEGIYELDAHSTDRAGNDSSFKDAGGSFKLTVDRTPPSISVSGIEEGGRYTLSEAVATVSVSDTIGVGAYEVDFGGKRLYSTKPNTTPPASQKVLLKPGMNETLLVKAQDKAGNESEYTVEKLTVSDNALVRYWANKPLVGGTAAVLALLAAAFILFGARRRKKEEE